MWILWITLWRNIICNREKDRTDLKTGKKEEKNKK